MHSSSTSAWHATAGACSQRCTGSLVCEDDVTPVLIALGGTLHRDGPHVWPRHAFAAGRCGSGDIRASTPSTVRMTATTSRPRCTNDANASCTGAELHEEAHVWRNALAARAYVSAYWARLRAWDGQHERRPHTELSSTTTAADTAKSCVPARQFQCPERGEGADCVSNPLRARSVDTPRTISLYVCANRQPREQPQVWQVSRKPLQIRGWPPQLQVFRLKRGGSTGVSAGSAEPQRGQCAARRCQGQIRGGEVPQR
jgi:hypothetical protein